MRALVSVSDKTGLDKLAFYLQQNDIEIVSSGGTREYIEKLGIPVTPIENITGNPEAFGGRMKTLSFQVASGLLFRRSLQSDLDQAKELGIEAIDVVVCNLYPFEEVKKSGADWEKLIENIDIGGPTLIRAGAKNYIDVWTLTSPAQYEDFIGYFKTNDRELGLTKRKNLARLAYGHCASYDALIAQTFDEEMGAENQNIHLSLAKARKTRYGENPHQQGFVVGENKLAGAIPLQGKELSYNNYLDSDAAWRCLQDLNFVQPDAYAVVIVKHSNPCGAAVAGTGVEALEKAWAGDQVSAFGSIIACNKKVDEQMADFLGKKFVEVIIAPEFEDKAKHIFGQKKNLRLIEMNDFSYGDELMVRTILGGHVIQQEDRISSVKIDPVTEVKFDLGQSLTDFGVRVTKHLKSNAIALVAQDENTFHLLGAGMGNPNRLVSIEQAVNKAQENGHEDLSRCLLVSDAFFPFRDNIDLAQRYGIKHIIQPGGSIKDDEVIAACNEHRIKMGMTGKRHFRH